VRVFHMQFAASSACDANRTEQLQFDRESNFTILFSWLDWSSRNLHL